ncbi:hypothetical protein FRX31_003002 [Thalictrum thalictroides]|uniref:Uncharacterized protein n=1 Tax=Thalictrum thalictroides TaxID=46969 RepID=A0A7J6XG05_THATH|nr:hypothetical protein FRX31_003002 [Thalictrum thalictroides]
MKEAAKNVQLMLRLYGIKDQQNEIGVAAEVQSAGKIHSSLTHGSASSGGIRTCFGDFSHGKMEENCFGGVELNLTFRNFKGEENVEYQENIEKTKAMFLMQKTILSKEQFGDHFVKGLNSEIKHLAQMFHPKELTHARSLVGLLKATEDAIAKGSIPSVRSQVSIKFSLESSSTLSLKKSLQYNSDTQSFDSVYMTATSYVTPKTIDMPGYSNSGHFTTKQLDKQLGCPLHATSKLW